MRLAIDVMGGDHAPDAILKGCVQGVDHLDDGDRLVLVGPETVIREYLNEVGRADDPHVEIQHAPDVIPMHAAPAKAVRAMPESSIVRMAKLASRKADPAVACDAALSAGNTGACVAASMMHMKRLSSVHRPGIAVTIPAFHGPVVLCDAGANPDPRASHLWQYGVMSEVFAKKSLGVKSPRVGLMNIGSEEGKGNELVRGAAAMLKATPGLNYIGFVEGRDFFSGAADVIVTDGFTGNTVLKMAEGFAKSIFQAIAHEIVSIDPSLALQFEPVVKQIYKKNDYHEHGGAPLMGVNGTMLIAHGSSEPRTIAAAIRNAKKFIELGINDAVVERLHEVEQHVQLATPDTEANAEANTKASVDHAADASTVESGPVGQGAA